MIIRRINTINLACELSYARLREEFPHLEDNEFNIDDNDENEYKPEYQDIFDKWYDYYFDLILNNSSNGED